ncbi:hypothetical protein [Streptomyces sp. OM5714]|uniref:hypothetical protein n=1 Tax=Streptomyces sp. OM5714 TaxID=2602736 RepID=UPI0013DCC829|nr:hypothetical protein [Streptomyces sp. OM5714]KAF2774646.1 hypothetical protein STPH1_7691 [Streptomyces sp. OM5714]
MSRLARPAGRIASGSAVVARRLASRAAAWVRRARRDDLTGVKAVLGCWLRLALLGLGLYLLWRLIRAVPNLMWVLTVGWLLASWRAGRPAPEQAIDTPTEGAPSMPSGEALRSLLLDLMGTAPAVHLSTVLDHLQQRPDTGPVTASWGVADLRARLERLGIPVHPKVKAGGKGPTRGVRRADLATSPAAAPETSTASSTAA